MATQLNVSAAHSRLSGILAATDRKRAFRAATRHSWLVRMLKLCMPLATLGLMAQYVMPAGFTIDTPKGPVSVQQIDIAAGGLKMVSPRYKGVNEKNGSYDIQAESALQHVSNTDLISFDKIHAELLSLQGQKTILTAPSGIFQRVKQEFTFDNSVTIGGEAGISGQLKTATAYMKENRLISNDPVVLGYHGHQVASDRVEFFNAEKRVIFTGHVRVHLERAAGQGGQQ